MPRVDPGQSELGIYSYGRISPGVKPNVCYIIDVSGLRDPQANRGFKSKYKDGRAVEIQSYVAEDKRVDAIVQQIQMLAHLHLRSECADKKWLSFGIRDHHGRWTSTAIAEIVALAVERSGYAVSVFHADLIRSEGK